MYMKRHISISFMLILVLFMKSDICSISTTVNSYHFCKIKLVGNFYKIFIFISININTQTIQIVKSVLTF